MVLRHLSRRDLTKIARTCSSMLWHVFDQHHWIPGGKKKLQLRKELGESSERIERILLENKRVFYSMNIPVLEKEFSNAPHF
jgi:hypothetical protein